MGELTERTKPMSRKLIEEAVDDAQFLVAHAASKCEKRIEGETIRTLTNAKRILDAGQTLDPTEEANFWLAYQDIWELVKPATADSIKANLPLEDSWMNRSLRKIRPFSQWMSENGTSRARKTVNRYIFFAVSVLILLLILQIYWVIGNQLTAQLTGLLQRETELSQEISKNQEAYSAIEIRFKQNETDSETFKTTGEYRFYSSPEWERDTLQVMATANQLDADLESLKSELERNSAILLVWSNPWKGFIQESVVETSSEEMDQYSAAIASIDRQIEETNNQLNADKDGSKAINEAKTQMEDLQKQLTELENNPEATPDQILNLRKQLDSLTDWLNQPGLAAQIIRESHQYLDRLEEEKAYLERQQQIAIKREESRQAQLAAQFVLVILQSYLLPLFYGILGAGTSVLRSLSKEVEKVTFSHDKRIQHVLRVALGALAGIMVGWFSFLIPNETTSFFGSVSPLAIAFLVGYNIELFFSLMDRALFSITDRLQRPTSTTEEEPKPTPTNAPTPPIQPMTTAMDTPAAGEAAG